MKFISFSHLLYIKSSLVIINRSEAKILELKNTVIEMKILLKGIQQQIFSKQEKESINYVQRHGFKLKCSKEYYCIIFLYDRNFWGRHIVN